MPFNRLVKPFSRLLGAPPQAAATQPHAAAPQPLSPGQIEAAATADADLAARIGAIRELPDGETLHTLAGLRGASTAAAPEVERAAQERVAQLVDSGAIGFEDLCAAPRSATALLAVAGHCANPDHLSAALDLVEDPHALAELAILGSSSRIRQLAAHRVEDPAALKALLKRSRERDKNVHKIVKHKCDQLRALERHDAQLEADAEAACASLERHGHRVHDPIYEPTFRHFLARWLTLEQRAAPAVRDRAHAAIERCRAIMDAHTRHIAEQQAAAARHAALQKEREAAAASDAQEQRRAMEAAAVAAAQAEQAREAEERALGEARAKEAQRLRRVSALAAGAIRALREGNTGRAAGLRRAIEEKRPQLPALPAYLAAQLHELDSKLNELKQWKDYAVAPKRAELIAEMEALVGSSEPPPALAERIRQLKDDWRTISKGVISESEADWQRFHQASVAAFQPCKEYFETQAKARQLNLQRRRSLLDRLQAFEAAQAGDHPDWRLMATAIREAHLEWRRSSPVDRTAGQALAKDFDAAMGRLQSRLHGWHERNAEQKRSLIERARELGASVDARAAMEEMKVLQQRWKTVGAAAHDLERRLWDEFRGLCEAVYQRRQQAQVERTAALQAAKDHALALCVTAEQAAECRGPALFAELAKIPQWRTAFESLGELPRADQRALHDRLERAIRGCQVQADRERARQHEEAVGRMIEAGRLIQHYGWAVAQGAPLADREALKQAAQGYIDGVGQWPKEAAAALKEAWAKAESAAKLDLAAQERALRMLCVRCEILTDRATPAEDQAMRREYQVHRLIERMGRGGAADADHLDALAIEWVRLGPVSSEAQASLLARFLRCRSTDDQQRPTAQ
jgi:hypothetical protein